jgi:uncharacterized membrane protein (DUF485 family)
MQAEGHMDQEHAAPQEEDRKTSRIKTRIGVRLVLLYGSLYLGFILINTISPGLMELDVLFGLNLAVSYGFGLIILAVVLGLVYNVVCTRKENQSAGSGKGRD